MITAKLLDFLGALVSFVTGLLPTMPVPGWVDGASGHLTTILGYGAGLGAWIPWQIAGIVFGSLMIALGISFGIKVARIVASFLTLGGGSAA